MTTIKTSKPRRAALRQFLLGPITGCAIAPSIDEAADDAELGEACRQTMPARAVDPGTVSESENLSTTEGVERRD